jgi:hypothetical protein
LFSGAIKIPHSVVFSSVFISLPNSRLVMQFARRRLAAKFNYSLSVLIFSTPTFSSLLLLAGSTDFFCPQSG